MRWGFWEIILIVVLVLILFKSAKIPAMMKDVAKGLKVFKDEVKEKPAKRPVAQKSTKTTPKKSALKKKTVK